MAEEIIHQETITQWNTPVITRYFKNKTNNAKYGNTQTENSKTMSRSLGLSEGFNGGRFVNSIGST